MKEMIRDICIVVTTVGVLCLCLSEKPFSSSDKCLRCNRMEQSAGGMRQRMAAQPHRGARSFEGRGAKKKAKKTP